MTTKDRVLALLIRSDGALSGEAIGDSLGISRAAVNGAIQSLRGEGYEIASATRRGYRLENAPDRLTAGEVFSFLDEARMERVVCLENVDSTNRYLAQLALEGAPDGQVVMADSQTAGRGRLSRAFHSPAGLGVYYSYLIRPDSSTRSGKDETHPVSGAAHPEYSPAAWTRLTCMTGVAVSEAVEAVCGTRPKIKWVNDLYLGESAMDGSPFGQKICGILTQMDMEPDSGHVRSIVVGIGVNVNHRKKDFPKEIRNLAGSIFTATGKTVPRALLAAQMTRAMDRLRISLQDPEGSYLARYREMSVLPGRDVTVFSGDSERKAKALCIEDDYALRVRYANGSEESLRGGEVSIRS